MKRILILGAGRSSTSLIRYLLNKAIDNKYFVTVADASLTLAHEKIANNPRGQAVGFDVNDVLQRESLIKDNDLVISLMPPPLHFTVAKTCVELSRHLITASYVSPEIASLNDLAKEKNVLIMMESGLDPGIDHMSAMKEINQILEEGGKLFAFRSYTGGLIAPESDNNPWHYKITWNPRNVVLAGKGISTYLENGKIREIDYKDLFTNIEKISVKNYGDFEGYPNRDSLKYLDTYNLSGLETFVRGTLRRPGYCSAWSMLVKSGFTNDEKIINNSENLSYQKISEQILHNVKGNSVKEKLLQFGSEKDVAMVEWLGLISNDQCPMTNFTPADLLQKLMEEKWKLLPGDKDMIVMQHQFEYVIEGKKKKITSSLVVKGEDEVHTAMAKTVGLPLGIIASLVLEGKINLSGVQIPVGKEIYEPVLKELEEFEIKFENESSGF